MGLQANSSFLGGINSNFVEGEKYYLESRGKDHDGIFEYFQYHDEYVVEKDIKLTNADKFFRQGFGPMHLMDFQFFNNLLNSFL